MSDSDASATAIAPKKRRGRPPGSGKARRHDPEDAPIDGDYGRDVVHGKQPGFQYALVADDDMPTMLGRGYVREERGEDSARPHYDLGRAGDAGYRVNNLTLMKITDPLYERAHAQGLAQANRRMAGLRREATQRSTSLSRVSEDSYSRTAI